MSKRCLHERDLKSDPPRLWDDLQLALMCSANMCQPLHSILYIRSRYEGPVLPCIPVPELNGLEKMHKFGEHLTTCNMPPIGLIHSLMQSHQFCVPQWCQVQNFTHLTSSFLFSSLITWDSLWAFCVWKVSRPFLTVREVDNMVQCALGLPVTTWKH